MHTFKDGIFYICNDKYVSLVLVQDRWLCDCCFLWYINFKSISKMLRLFVIIAKKKIFDYDLINDINTIDSDKFWL